MAAGSSTLAGVYKNLTGDGSNPFPLFENILGLWFPSTTNSAVQAPNLDDPWPLSPIGYTGVWRSGSEPYYLWIHAPQDDFLNKWQTLASQNLRLTDIEVTTLNGQTLAFRPRLVVRAAAACPTRRLRGAPWRRRQPAKAAAGYVLFTRSRSSRSSSAE